MTSIVACCRSTFLTPWLGKRPFCVFLSSAVILTKVINICQREKDEDCPDETITDSKKMEHNSWTYGSSTFFRGPYPFARRFRSFYRAIRRFRLVHHRHVQRALVAEGSVFHLWRVLHFVCLNWNPLMLPMISVRYLLQFSVYRVHVGNVTSHFSFHQQQPPYDTTRLAYWPRTELCSLLFFFLVDDVLFLIVPLRSTTLSLYL